MQTYLDNLTNYLLTQSWQIALLVLVIATATWLLKNKSAHIRYLLWLIVLAKCLVPPLLAIPLPILPEEKPILLLETPPPMISEPVVSPPASDARPPAPARHRRPEPRKTFTARQWLALCWISGLVAFLLFALAKAWRTNRWLRRQRKPLPGELQTSIVNLFSTIGIKNPTQNTTCHSERSEESLISAGQTLRFAQGDNLKIVSKSFPKVWLINGIGQPFVWGLLRGSIYLPANFVKVDNAEHRKGILGHELSHILRFDAAVNVLQVIAQAIFWFHPFVWWANKKIRAEREKCCDEMAIARLGAKVKDYSSAIVNILICEHESTRPIPSLAVAGPVKNIEERIKTMLRPGKKFYKRPSLLAVTVVLVLALLTVPTALVLTARAETKATSEQKPEPAKSLHQAAADGEIEQVKSLISKGADINAKDKLGKTALHYAAEKGHAEVAKLLISHRAYVNAMDRNWAKPLHYAAMRGDKQTVELLISEGADIDAQNKNGRGPWFEAMRSLAAGRKEVVELLAAKGAKVPAFHLAAFIGDMDKLKKLLEEGTNVNTPAMYNTTALHAAANSGKKDIVEFLINKGANVDARDTFGLAPLYYAALHNYEDIADLLVDKGTDINAKDKKGYTLLYYAMWDEGDKGKDAIKLLISKGANVGEKDPNGFTPLNWAIWLGYKGIAELLINNGADVNAEDKDGLTPYYWAAVYGRKDIVDLLTAKGATPVSTIHLAARAGDLAKVKSFIEEGTDVNSRDKIGQTPLFSAILADNNDITKFLIAKGADVNAKDQDGSTPLHEAVDKSNRDIVEILIAKGADVNAKEKDGYTALHQAAARGFQDLARLLIANGGDVNAKSTGGPMSGRTPLDVASCWGRKDLAELLIAKGADINSRADNGDTPLNSACLRGHKNVAELLIAKGADMNAKDNKGRTALSSAKEQGHTEIVELLRKHGAKE